MGARCSAEDFAEREIARFFDTLAPSWDAEHPACERAEAVRRGLDLAEPLWGAFVMDAGCGTGVLIRPLLERIGPGRVIAVDISPEMVARARSKVQDDRVQFVAGDARSIGSLEGLVDVVLCFDAFPHFGEPGPALRALARLLAPGGRLVIWHDIGRERLAEVHREAGGPVGQHVLPEVAVLAGLCEEAGLRPVFFEEGPDRYTMLAVRSA